MTEIAYPLATNGSNSNGAPPVPALTATEETQEFLAGGHMALGNGILPYGETNFDRATYAYGLVRVVNQMLADPKIGAAIDSIKMAVLADGIQVTPAILPKFGASSDQSEFDEETETDAKNAFEAGQFVARCIDRLTCPVPAETSLWQLLDYMFYGVKLAEKVYEVPDVGIDAGKLVISRIKVKSQLAWGFVQDRYGNVLGITGGGQRAGDVVKGEKEGTRYISALPRDKFVIFTNNPQEDDPRGRSIGPRVYDPFYNKLQTIVRYLKYLSKFAAPTVVGMVGPNEESQADRDPVTGKVKGTTTTPVGRMANELAKIENCAYIAVANGASIELKFPTGDGKAFLDALAYWDKQMVSALVHAARSTEESQFGSRADSETAQDATGVLIRYYKRSVAQMIREDIARDLILKNYGQDWSDRYCPVISLGLIEHQDFSRNGGTVAKLWTSGMLDESQRPGLCSFLGLPLPKPRPVQPLGPDGKPLAPGAGVNPTQPGGGQPKPGAKPKDSAAK